MWTRNLLLGVRGVLAPVALVVASTASISALGIYRREGSLDSTVVVALGAWVVMASLWPDEEYRIKLLEQYRTEQRKPPFWLLPALGAVMTGLLLLILFSMTLYLSQEEMSSQLELDLAVKRGEYIVERQVARELASLVCQNSATPVECHPRLLEEVRRFVVDQLTNG